MKSISPLIISELSLTLYSGGLLLDQSCTVTRSVHCLAPSWCVASTTLQSVTDIWYLRSMHTAASVNMPLPSFCILTLKEVLLLGGSPMPGAELPSVL